ncbi:MAG: TIGR02391 family protein [Bacillota bacterium]
MTLDNFSDISMVGKLSTYFGDDFKSTPIDICKLLSGETTFKEEVDFEKELLESIFHLVRNPAAHTLKINWQIDETKALDILTLISFAHKYLDKCNKMPGK